MLKTGLGGVAMPGASQAVIDAHPDDSATAEVMTADGLRLAAAVLPAATRRSRGAVIFVHGFCGNRDENGLFDTLAEHCAAAGFDTVRYDWRGIGDSEGEFPATCLDDHVADFEQVVEWTRAHFAGACAVHAVGFSLGAAVVGLALKRQMQLQAVAYLSPAVRPSVSMWPRYDRPDLWRELDRRGVVEKPGSSVLLGQAILGSLRDTDLGPQAFDLDVPLLVCHGTNDARIDCSHSRALAEQRSARPGDFVYREFEGASHSFRRADDCWPELASAVAKWFAGGSGGRRTKRARGGRAVSLA